MEGVTETESTDNAGAQQQLERKDLVSIANALLLFTTEHGRRGSKPKMNVTWNNGLFTTTKSVQFSWTLAKTTQSFDWDLYRWGNQCEGLQKCLKPKYDAYPISLEDDWSGCHCVINKKKVYWAWP